MPDPRPEPPHEDVPERLLARFTEGDGGAFERLVHLYEESIFSFLFRMTGDSHLAEDVFQQVWIKVAVNAAMYDGRASFSTWLYRIARNAALDELRRRRRIPEISGLDAERMDDPRADAAPSPLENMTRRELGERIHLALQMLPAPQREAFLLKEEGDLSFEAIGEILGCGRETAKSRFRLAVGKLRLLLSQEGGAS